MEKIVVIKTETPEWEWDLREVKKIKNHGNVVMIKAGPYESALDVENIVDKHLKSIKPGDMLQFLSDGPCIMQIYDVQGRQVYHHN